MSVRRTRHLAADGGRVVVMRLTVVTLAVALLGAVCLTVASGVRTSTPAAAACANPVVCENSLPGAPSHRPAAAVVA